MIRLVVPPLVSFCLLLLFRFFERYFYFSFSELIYASFIWNLGSPSYLNEYLISGNYQVGAALQRFCAFVVNHLLCFFHCELHVSQTGLIFSSKKNLILLAPLINLILSVLLLQIHLFCLALHHHLL